MTKKRAPRPAPKSFHQIWNESGFSTASFSRLRATNVMPDDATSFAGLAEELQHRCDRSGAYVGVDGFLATGQSFEERLDRRATVLLIAKLTAGEATAELDWPGWQPDDSNTRRRTFTPIERGLVRFCALTSDMTAVRVGVADAGAMSGELPHILTTHVVCDDTSPLGVNMPGNVRSIAGGGPSGAQPRYAELPQWCRRRVGQHMNTLFDEPHLLYVGTCDVPAKVQSSILMAIGTVIKAAGLGDDPTVEPMSVRNTAGRAIWQEHGLDAAARFLGYTDFNVVSREIGRTAHPPLRERRAR